jgi:hypothetical protein
MEQMTRDASRRSEQPRTPRCHERRIARQERQLTRGVAEGSTRRPRCLARGKQAAQRVGELKRLAQIRPEILDIFEAHAQA